MEIMYLPYNIKELKVDNKTEDKKASEMIENMKLAFASIGKHVYL